eukprot:403373722
MTPTTKRAAATKVNKKLMNKKQVKVQPKKVSIKSKHKLSKSAPLKQKKKHIEEAKHEILGKRARKPLKTEGEFEAIIEKKDKVIKGAKLNGVLRSSSRNGKQQTQNTKSEPIPKIQVNKRTQKQQSKEEVKTSKVQENGLNQSEPRRRLQRNASVKDEEEIKSVQVQKQKNKQNVKESKDIKREALVKHEKESTAIKNEDTDKKSDVAKLVKQEKKEQIALVKRRKSSDRGSRALVGINTQQNLVIQKTSGEKTLIEIIEDSRSGIPAKSELESKEQKAFLKKQKLEMKDEEGESKNSSAQPKTFLMNDQPKKAQSVASQNESAQKSLNQSAAQASIISRPKIIIINGKPQIQAPLLNFQQQRENAIALANENREITVVNSSNNKLSSLSFMKRQPAEKWKPEETKKFYMALQIFGTDFSLIEKVFNQERSREQIKNKFRKEERKNKKFIDDLLNNKERINLKDFEEQFGKTDLGIGDDFVDEAEDLLKSDDESSDDSSNSDDSENDSEEKTPNNEGSATNQSQSIDPSKSNLLQKTVGSFINKFNMQNNSAIKLEAGSESDSRFGSDFKANILSNNRQLIEGKQTASSSGFSPFKMLQQSNISNQIQGASKSAFQKPGMLQNSQSQNKSAAPLQQSQQTINNSQKSQSTSIQNFKINTF